MNWQDQLAEGLHRLPPRLHRLVPPDQRADLRHRLGRYRPWESGADLMPPPRGPGEEPGPPDFVGVGVMMAASDWWLGLVNDHPGVAWRPDVPGARHYLSHFLTTDLGPAEVDRYHGWFPRRPGAITGEWTPSYSALPWVAPLLARAAPDARLLMMVRDPVDRLRLGLASTADRRVPQVGDHTADAVARGFYGAQLRRLLEYFPTDRVLVLQYERCVADPAEQIAATYRFLGLDDGYRPVVGAPPRQALGPLPPLDPDTTVRLARVYADDVEELVALVPSLDRSLWPSAIDRRR